MPPLCDFASKTNGEVSNKPDQFYAAFAAQMCYCTQFSARLAFPVAWTFWKHKRGLHHTITTSKACFQRTWKIFSDSESNISKDSRAR
ncbi:hypothetical protein L917_05812 [Phytophthora nicotianae]|uniref:Uncharacterized protein n=2 Tax=Phytophthora nicotianae TaxID=4792 RepID=V9FFS0_PHYNI|nr:hypothetical protein F443_06110 [Phytophthora nicotianae P1569]ETL96767.1 hypothetical protein L917_05812 [Phytophthora nicotianae]